MIVAQNGEWRMTDCRWFHCSENGERRQQRTLLLWEWRMNETGHATTVRMENEKRIELWWSENGEWAEDRMKLEWEWIMN